jgi:hypothetical protein
MSKEKDVVNNSDDRENELVVWTLTITRGIDDYKHRGECASSKTYVYSTEEKCLRKLREIIIEKVMNIDYESDIPDCNICELEKYKDDDSDEHPSYFVKDSEGYYSYNKKIDIDDLPIEGFYEYVAEAEYIPYKWTYKIQSHLVV